LTFPTRLGRSAAFVCPLGVLVASCGSSSSNGTFTLDFPSVAAAVATDTVQIGAFDGSDPAACTTLVVQARSQQTLPSVLSETSASPCALASGGGSLALKSGTYAFMAIGLRQGQNFVIGCQEATIGSSGGTVNIELTLFDNLVSVPPTGCQSLSPHCSGKC
jgi:hypothetical protein